ncbi:type II/IV secretion system protein [Campylobacter upsaliensis]|uniref:GspE/PulE family protein n=1 Tax=Campylobacter upsaliensis TaxID=28080 RepID=UPI0012CBF800|nr:type II/IV secretion system protein [Campylobacter upsaliensis]EAJ9122478.1 type II/IV secretion system protein [Campylobacter upsaliensis]EHZ0305331.1 type II/IV secretion system protein [Campylobacter upsaliensis]
MMEFLKNLGFDKEAKEGFEDENLRHFLFELYLKNELDLNLLFVNLGVKSEDFLRALARHLDLEFVELKDIDENLCDSFAFSLLWKNQILPLQKDDESIFILSSKPINLELLSKIEHLFRSKFIKNALCDIYSLNQNLNKLYIKQKLKELSSNLKQELNANSKENEQSGVSLLFNFILQEALKLRASDVHIESLENEALIRFRVDGVLRLFCVLEEQLYQALIFHIKLLAHLNVAQSRKAQDGSFNKNYEGVEFDFRISTLPLQKGESVVLRILRQDLELLSLENLHFSKQNLALITKNIQKPFGMILLTGPTGSGKSTTLYACLKSLACVEKKIITAEDPIEYKMPQIQQIALNSKAGLDFSNALRAILRQDPDIIMVGEIRDEESLDIALKGAQTGHLILSTLHTNDALSTIERLLDMRAKPYLIASSLNLIIAQRLARRLCPYCKMQKLEDEEVFYEAKGCEKCHFSGFWGRELLEECLELDEGLKELIRKNASKNELLTYARKQGFLTMFELGLKKAKSGIISLNELMRVVG